MNKKAFAVIAFSMFVSMLGFGIVVPLLPIYADKLGATGLEIGMMYAAFGITHAIFLPFIGKLSDRMGRKIFLCLGLLSLTFVSIGFIWVQNAFHLIVTRIMQGIATTMHLPIAQAYVGDITPVGEEGRWMGHFNTIFFSGMGLGPLFGGVLTDLYSVNITFMVMATLNLVGFIGTVFFLPEVKGMHVDKKQSVSYILLLKNKIIKGLFTYRLVVGIGTAALMTFLPVFAHRRLGLTTTLIGILLACRTPVSLLQSFTGILADKYTSIITSILYRHIGR